MTDLAHLIARARLGFTGTSSPPGMTAYQRQEFRRLVRGLQPIEFHHADCIEADEQAHEIVYRLSRTIRIVVHPPLTLDKRACCLGDVTMPANEYLERNRDIVDAVDLLVATPKEHEEQLRSGTWSTMRYARKKGVPVIIIPPLPEAPA